MSLNYGAANVNKAFIRVMVGVSGVQHATQRCAHGGLLRAGGAPHILAGGQHRGAWLRHWRLASALWNRDRWLLGDGAIDGTDRWRWHRWHWHRWKALKAVIDGTDH
jgi:hypothetical protein